MPQDKAFCEEYGRNITLQEAHQLYFAQPESTRRRFTFRCGDPRCRAMLQPKVAAALYTREDSVADPSRRSPYYREIAKFKHILTCTWINGETKPEHATDGSSSPKPSSTISEELGLVFKLKARKSGGGNRAAECTPDDDLPDADEDTDTPSRGRSTSPRAETCKVMATVAMKYLHYSDQQLRTIELTLEGIRKAPFYNICMPINAFHPFYQTQQIYYGRVKVTELTNVFFVRFSRSMSPTGDSEHRTTVAEIKLRKSWLEEHDRALASLLTELDQTRRTAWCFFYTAEPPMMMHERAQFTIPDPQHLAIVDEAEIHRLNQEQ